MSAMMSPVTTAGPSGEGVTRRGAGASGLGVNVGWGFGAGPTAGWSL